MKKPSVTICEASDKEAMGLYKAIKGLSTENIGLGRRNDSIHLYA